MLDLLLCPRFASLVSGQDGVQTLLLKEEIAQNFMNLLREVVVLSCGPERSNLSENH